MGNAYSENPKCECESTKKPSSTSTSRRCCGTLRQEVCGLEAVSGPSVNSLGFRKSRNRSLSLGEGKMEVDVSEKEKPLSCHNYDLRLRTKIKTKCDSASSTLSVLGNNNEKSTRSQFLKDKVLALSFDKLSLDSRTTNSIDDMKETSQKKGRRRKSKEKPSEKDADKGVEEDEEGLQLPKHVLYYGYFFTPETSTVINQVVMYYFRLFYTKVPQFERFILTCCKEADIRDPFEYYKRPGKRVKPTDELEYHVTAKFLGRDPDPPYQTLVHPFLQKIFYIRLVGIVFTPKSLGVRVKLSPAQQLIFDEKTDSKAGCKLASIAPKQINGISDAEIQSQLHSEIEGYSQALKKHKKMHPNCKLHKTGTGAGGENSTLFFKRSGDPLSLRTTTSRAHITIGCAPNVKAMQTGEDLVDVIDLEQRPATSSDSNFQQDFKVERGVLRQFGKHANAFVLYSDTDMIVPGRFDVFI